MNGFLNRPPTIQDLKDQALRLRRALEHSGVSITHSKSLELLAQQHGYRDWNTIHAAIKNDPQPLWGRIGARVRGRYLGQTFEGEVVGIKAIAASDRMHITLHFDAPVNVVTFDSFSNLRTRVSCILDKSGKTAEKTSDDRPHVQLEVEPRCA